MMLSNSKYAVDGAILFYSGYSYAWGVYCATPEMAKDHQDGDNPNWTKYQLSYQGQFQVIENNMLESLNQDVGHFFQSLTTISKSGGCDCTELEQKVTGNGETEIDTRCLDIPNDPLAGLGCDACDVPDCRFCNFGDYPSCGGALNMP